MGDVAGAISGKDCAATARATPAMISLASHSLPLGQAAPLRSGCRTHRSFQRTWHASGHLPPRFPLSVHWLSSLLKSPILMLSSLPGSAPAAPSRGMSWVLLRWVAVPLSSQIRLSLSPRAAWYSCLPLRHSSLSIFQAGPLSFLIPNT